MSRSVSIVIPTYNEAKNVPLLVEEIFSYLQPSGIDTELIIVDDNSPDETWKIAEELSNQYPVKVIKRAGKMGLGSAVRAGFAAAEGEILGVMDADLSHDPSILVPMIRAIGDNDLVIGSRFEDGSSVENWAIWRKLISKVGVAIARALTGVKDPLSGYFLFKKSILDQVALDTVGYKILLEILIKGNHRAVKEFPFRFRMRMHSVSKLNMKEYWLFIKQLINYGFYKLFKKKKTV